MNDLKNKEKIKMKKKMIAILLSTLSSVYASQDMTEMESKTPAPHHQGIEENRQELMKEINEKKNVFISTLQKSRVILQQTTNPFNEAMKKRLSLLAARSGLLASVLDQVHRQTVENPFFSGKIEKIFLDLLDPRKLHTNELSFLPHMMLSLAKQKTFDFNAQTITASANLFADGSSSMEESLALHLGETTPENTPQHTAHLKELYENSLSSYEGREDSEEPALLYVKLARFHETGQFGFDKDEIKAKEFWIRAFHRVTEGNEPENLSMDSISNEVTQEAIDHMMEEEDVNITLAALDIFSHPQSPVKNNLLTKALLEKAMEAVRELPNNKELEGHEKIMTILDSFQLVRFLEEKRPGTEDFQDDYRELIEIFASLGHHEAIRKKQGMQARTKSAKRAFSKPNPLAKRQAL